MTFDLEKAIASYTPKPAQEKMDTSSEDKPEITQKLVEALEAYGIKARVNKLLGQSAIPRATFSKKGVTFNVSVRSKNFDYEEQQWIYYGIDEAGRPLSLSYSSIWNATKNEIHYSDGTLEQVAYDVLEILRQQEPYYDANEKRLEESRLVEPELDQKIKEANESLWQWPRGKTLSLYKWIWVSGLTEGKTSIEFGWSLADKLDADGYIKLMPEDQHGALAHRREERQIKWIFSDAQQLFPITIEKHTFSSIEALPSELARWYTHKIKGYKWASAWGFDPEMDLWIAGSSVVRDEQNTLDSDTYDELGYKLPLKWVQDAVDGVLG